MGASDLGQQLYILLSDRRFSEVDSGEDNHLRHRGCVRIMQNMFSVQFRATATQNDRWSVAGIENLVDAHLVTEVFLGRAHECAHLVVCTD